MCLFDVFFEWFCSKQTLDYQGLFQVKPPFRVESTRIADEVTELTPVETAASKSKT